MRFVYDAGWTEIPEIIKQGIDSATGMVFNEMTAVILEVIRIGGQWLISNGIYFVGEMFLIWGMCCLLVGCTGSGKWVERGVKSVLVSVMIGLVKYAI